MLHLVKLSVGIRDIAQLQAVQAERTAREPPLRHRTRNFPRRAAEILAGGSIYWSIGNALVVRQAVRDIIEDRWDDGSACAAIVLDPVLVPTEARPIKPFQGWRYLTEADAPRDLRAMAARGVQDLPPALLRELRALCLL